MTRLSVVMTNYNHGRYLKSRISSILEQLSEDDEFVIVDDGSTDESVSIIRSFVELDSRILFYQNEKNIGVVASVNKALDCARGEYVASLAADDHLLPGFVEKMMKVLTNYPSVGLCTSDCGLYYEDREKKIETTKLLQTEQSVHVFSGEHVVKTLRSTNFWIPGHASIIKRELMIRYGRFDPNLQFLCDWFLIHSIALNHGAAYIPETLALWTQHPSTYSATIQSNIEKRNSVYSNFLKKLTLKENRHLRRLFRISNLTHFSTRTLFWRLIWKPFYWDFVSSCVCKFIRNRLKKYIPMNRSLG